MGLQHPVKLDGHGGQPVVPAQEVGEATTEASWLARGAAQCERALAQLSQLITWKSIKEDT